LLHFFARVWLSVGNPAYADGFVHALPTSMLTLETEVITGSLYKIAINC